MATTPRGERLRRARLECGLTQVQLARASGVDQSTISAGERAVDWQPNASTAASLERALGLPAGYLSSDSLQEPSASLDAFLQTPEAHALGLQPDEVREARAVLWYGPGQEPSTMSWVDFFRARRGLRRT